MPFCTNCGSQVGPQDAFCGGCGTRQGSASAPGDTREWASTGPSAPRQDFFAHIPDRRAALFCYFPWIGWIASIIVLASDRFREQREIRFHAFQGLYLFVLWLFVDWVFGPIAAFTESSRFIGGAMKVAVIGTWIFMIVKTSQGENFRLPIIGELADRSVSEQK
jgi:uncharacterized membrane protein